MNKFSKILSFVSISLLLMTNVNAQDWNITNDQKALKLSVAFSEDNQDAGEAIFKKSCKMCHGDISVAPTNDRALPLAPNLGAIDWHKANTDGEIFTKITSGKGGMPPFSGSLSDEDRWKVVAYIRANFDGYTPPNAGTADVAKPKANKFKGTIKAINANYNDNDNNFIVKVIAVDENGHPAKAAGVKVDLYLQRYFGNMALVEGERTNEDGEVIVEGGALKADLEGNIKIIARTSDKAFSSEKTITIAEARNWENPIEGRHLWGTSARTPLALLISYLVVTLGSLSVIGWAVFQLLRIRNLRER